MGDNMANKQKVSNEDIYELLQAQNLEIKNELKFIKEKIFTQDNLIHEIRSENLELKGKHKQLENRLKTLERQIRHNNIVFYNLADRDGVSLIDHTRDFVNRQLAVKIDTKDIVDVYRLGKNSQDINKPRPVLLKLISGIKKREIVANFRKLKGSGVSASEDLPEEDREKKRVLYNHYRSAKIKGYVTKLLSNAVIIAGQQYTYEDLKSSGTSQKVQGTQYLNLQRGSVSAPNSPIRNRLVISGENLQDTLRKTSEETSEIAGSSQGNLWNSEGDAIEDPIGGDIGQGAIPKYGKNISGIRTRSNSKTSVTTLPSQKGEQKDKAARY